MKTLFKQPFPMLVAAIVTIATLAACSGEMNPADVPTGELQAIAVKFSTPSTGQAAAENPWQDNDRVTVTPEAAPNGAITFEYIEQEDTWRNILAGENSYFKAILPAGFTAYYPTEVGTNLKAFTLPAISNDAQTGQANQSSAALLHAADYMTAPVTTVVRADQGLNQVLDLTLAHRLCRLTFIVTEYGNEFNGLKPELTDVKIKSQNRTVNLTYEGDKVEVATTTGNPVWVSPLTDANANGQLTYTAIVTPCTLTSGDTELMSLTVNGTTLRVKYKGNLTALASGSAYTFHLQVGKDYVTVTKSDVTGWTGKTTDVTSYDVFIVSNLKIGDYYYSDGTWGDGGLRKLYSDGTYQMEEDITPDPRRTLVGIVMKVGRDDDGNWKDDCDYISQKPTSPMNISGYVLALYDANEGKTCQWSSIGIKVGTNTEQNIGFYGYTNTNTIKAFAVTQGGNLETTFPATYYATEGYEKTNPAPAATSGWFLPSAGQCKHWYDNKAVLLKSVQRATEKNGYDWQSNYWSSSESYNGPAGNAWYLNFRYGGVFGGYKDYSYYVRSVLAF